MASEPTNANERTTLTALPWTVEKCADIKRSLSNRANNARRSSELPLPELFDMARLYLMVDRVDETFRQEHSLPPTSTPPEWVRHALS